MAKEILFSVTASDCEWSYTKGTGAGGQKRNKTSSAVHCKHRPSGAAGYSEASRSQLDNKQDAFVKMANTKEFKTWHHMETLRRNGKMRQIDDHVARELRKVKVEIKSDEGKWVEVDKDALLPVVRHDITSSALA
jgi:protein subunit release factor B